MLNLNKLYDVYIEENEKILKEKDEALESFRKVESDFKHYEDALNKLEKEKNKSKIDSYQGLSENILTKLRLFNPKNLQVNVKPIEREIAYLKEHGIEIANVSQKFQHTENKWILFIERNKKLDKSSRFIKNIYENINEIKDGFRDITLDDLSRIEEDIIDINRSIDRSISMIEILTRLLEENDFIGKEPNELKERIIKFIEEDYKTMSLLKINEFYRGIEEEIKIFKKDKIKKRIKAKVIKIMNNSDRSIYNYGIEINDILLYPTEKITSDEFLEDTGEFLYIDNFPVYGIISVEEIREEIEVSDNQFFANKELNDISGVFFIIGVIASIIVISFTLFGHNSPVVTVPIIFLIQGLFTFLFQGLKYRISSKFGVPKMFYFFKISYFFVKVGDDGLNVQNIVPKLLESFPKLISNDLSFPKIKDKIRKIKEEKKLMMIEEDDNEETDKNINLEKIDSGGEK